MGRGVGVSGRAVSISGRSQIIGSAIPDSGDLHARYDASELSLNDGDAVSTWSDETDNANGLSAGYAPTYRTSVINGNPVVRFDGIDDFLDVAFPTLSQPNHIFVVGQLRDTDTGNFRALFDSVEGSSPHTLGAGSNDNFRIFAGEGLVDGADDTSPHIFGTLFDGATSTIRLDGSQTASGDSGAGGLNGFRVGAGRGTASFYGPFDVGEILVYPQDKTGVQSDIEQYLSDKWGITL